ncbi:cysteine desulfurase family protein [Pseudarthrobacter sp. S9]|uniref:cysteine desulfurase family protein n=1 Tax=Pseudarthrobacter sp. S9 TaxID=3418421 RepID=UPI003D04F073
MIFLDAAATTPVRREVLEAMWPYLSGEFGNPSSHHSLGDAAAAALAGARAATATALGCRPGEIIFTSGGTEADNLAVKGIALARRAADPRLDRVAISAVEHPAVEESARYLERVHGFAVDVIPVDSFGQVTVEALAGVLRPETALVSVMYANNEVGTVQPVARLAALARARGIPFHTDAVQAAGWLPLDTAALGVDALSLSGHKLGAPKGNGALFVRGRTRLEPLVHGGGQERGRRSGTENVAGAVALATALTLARTSRPGAPEDPGSRVAALRDDFIRAVLAGVPGAILTGHPTERLPSVASFCFPGTSGESVLLELERQGVICSSGSACAAGSDAPSSVLLALGIDAEVAQTAVRFSFDPTVTADELRQAAAAVGIAVAGVQSLGPAR